LRAGGLDSTCAAPCPGGPTGAQPAARSLHPCVDDSTTARKFVVEVMMVYKHRMRCVRSAVAILVIAGCSGKATQTPSSTGSGAPASGEKVAPAVEPSEGGAGSGAADPSPASAAGPSAPAPAPTPPPASPAPSASVAVTLADVGLE